MNRITGKHLSRRTMLRGTGVAIALPLLDAMRPALASPTARQSAPWRLGVVYVPNGVVMQDWLPAETGRDYTFTRILKPLEPLRDEITLISGLSNQAASKTRGGAHAKASGSFLSGMPTRHTAGADVRAGITFDQVAAAQWGTATRVPSLQLGCEDSRMVGNCDSGSSCAYTNSLSWRDADTPLMVEVNPRAVFERLFGSEDPSLSPEARARRARQRRSILDGDREQTHALLREVGPADRRRMDQYLTSIREIETRIEAIESDDSVPPADKPAGIPFEYRDYVELMFNLQALAFQADHCRVSTIMLGREGSVRTYPEIDVPDPHHPLTHHRGHPDFIEKVTRINCYHVELFAGFLRRLQETPDGEGTLLDHVRILYGSAMSDGNGHSYHDLPLLVAGGGIGRQAGHVRVSDQPVANLFVGLLNRVGIETEHFGNSTGCLTIH
jgi:hypothetical protein